MAVIFRSIVHLSQQEQRTIINALVEQRERQENTLTQTEQLLRRMTGSITAYINGTSGPGRSRSHPGFFQ